MEDHAYLDFEVEIDPPDAEGIAAVTLLRAPGGEATGALNLNALSPDTRNGEPPQNAMAARTIGAELFDSLLQGELRSRFDVSVQLAAAQKAGLRIRLRLSSPEVAQLPWELLFDARRDEFIALSRATPIVRYLPVGAPIESLVVEPPLRILAMAASPSDLPPVDGAAERESLKQAIAPLQRKGTVEVVWLEGQSWRELQSAMQAGPWHIFHYVGHAQLNPTTGAGELLLADADGRAAPIDATQLAALLEDHKSLRLVVLNACEGARADEAQPFSSLAVALVRSGITSVLAMQQEISTTAARELTRAFYGALAAGLPVDAAVGEARKAMHLAAPTTVEWATPVLFLRAPDAALWETKPVKVPLKRIAFAISASLAMFVSVWALVYYFILPAFFPTQMPDLSFNIAVADFGVLDGNGQMRASGLGSELSQAVFEDLAAQYANFSDVIAAPVTIWHDSLGREVKNVALAPIAGRDEKERAAHARELAQHINANMVVYGFLESGEGTESLTLEYYNATPENVGEPSPTAGNARFGAPIRVSSADPALLGRRLLTQTQQRISILFGITQALIYQFLNEPQRALDVLATTEQRLQQLSSEQGEGIELIYLFRAQAALTLRDYATAETALDAALAIDPDYINANLMQAALLMDRAQLFYLRGRPPEELQNACVQIATLDISSPSQEAAVADAQEAVRILEDALTRAPESSWATAELYIGMNLGLAYRILGQAHIFGQDLDAAENALNLAATHLETARQSFSPERQPQFIGWTDAGLGATYALQGSLRDAQRVQAINDGEEAIAATWRGEALAFFNKSVAAFDSCIAQGDHSSNEVFKDRVVKCACEGYADTMRTVVQSMEDAP